MGLQHRQVYLSQTRRRSQAVPWVEPYIEPAVEENRGTSFWKSQAYLGNLHTFPMESGSNASVLQL